MMNSENDDLDLDQTSLTADQHQAIDKAWAVEIQRRSAELQNGMLQTIPWSEVKLHSRKRLSGPIPGQIGNSDEAIE